MLPFVWFIGFFLVVLEINKPIGSILICLIVLLFYIITFIILLYIIGKVILNVKKRRAKRRW